MGTHRDREIVAAEVIVTCPARNFVTLKIVTRSGVTGLGDATLNGRELAVASYLKDHLVPNLIGRDAGRIEDIWQFFYRGAYWRRGPVTMTAIAAVDVALWDILGKMSNQPLYQLLGGRSREGALVYGHANGKDIDETQRRSRQVHRAGLQGGARAVRRAGHQEGLRHLESEERVRAGRERAAGRDRVVDAEVSGHRAEAVRAPAQGSRPRHRAAARRASSPHADRSRAARRAISSRIGCSGWKTATPAENQKSFELIRKHTVTPLAVGEVFNSIWDCKHLIENQLIDYIRTTIVHGGGITHRAAHRRFRGAAQRAHRLPRRHGSVAGVHGRGAALRHLGAELRHPGIHEARAGDRRGVPARLHVQGRPAVLRRERRATASTIDEKLAAKYPYNPKQLPVARLEDGTMWDW